MSHILVIEDNEEIACSVRKNLEVEGYAVSLAADGLEGLVQAQRSHPDLVVIDLMLPRLGGLQVIRSLRDSGFNRPILVLSARREETDKVRSLRFGADDYVTKPFSLVDFLARVEALLRRSAHSDTNTRARCGGEVGSVELNPLPRVVSRSEAGAV